MSREEVSDVVVAATTRPTKLAGYNHHYKSLEAYDSKVSGEMFPESLLNHTPIGVGITPGYRFTTQGPGKMGEGVCGYCIESLRKMKESFVASEGNQMDSLTALFSKHPDLRWDEHKTQDSTLHERQKPHVVPPEEYVESCTFEPVLFS